MEINPFKRYDNEEYIKKGMPSGDYRWGATECDCCKDSFDCLVKESSLGYDSEVAICFTCCVHRHGMREALSIYEELTKIDQYKWEFKAEKKKTINDKKEE